MPLLSMGVEAFRSRAALQLEILALRHQLAVLQHAGPKRPRLPPSDRVFWVCLAKLWPGGGRALTEGIEVHKIEGVRVQVYSPAKSVADCFKYRNKIGLDVAIEALRERIKRETFERMTRENLGRAA